MDVPYRLPCTCNGEKAEGAENALLYECNSLKRLTHLSPLKESTLRHLLCKLLLGCEVVVLPVLRTGKEAERGVQI
jgi:hypothetical protein